MILGIIADDFTGATDVALPLELARRLDLRLRPGGISVTANPTVNKEAAATDVAGGRPGSDRN